MKKRWISLLLMTVMVFSLGGCDNENGDSKQAENSGLEVQSFSNWTDNELFQTVPAMNVSDTWVGEVRDCGQNDYVLDVNGTDLADYQSYLKLLEENGYTKYVDNGEEGLDGAVYTATYTKDTVVLTVAQLVKCNKTYISVCDGIELSPNMFYDDSYLDVDTGDAKTTLHMLELYDYGNSFVIQLKNGHFILNDGGTKEDFPYLVEYLESLVPEGEKPVIDAWFISHPHGDHIGWLKGIYEHQDYIERFCVEAIYFNLPGEDIYIWESSQTDEFVKRYIYLSDSKGETPKVYRPEIGQRYYFDDITVDIVSTQEQLVPENHTQTVNDSSMWLMYTIEGQKFMLCGDAAAGAAKNAMRIYDSSYFEMDVFTAFHHGLNVYDYFTDYCTFKTVLYPGYRCGSKSTAEDRVHEAENAHLIESAQEAIAYGKGTVVLTFPYEVGTAEIMPAQEWIYHPGERVYEEERLEEFEAYIINKK